jgi:small subunit ribosomal protein S2
MQLRVFNHSLDYCLTRYPMIVRQSCGRHGSSLAFLIAMLNTNVVYVGRSVLRAFSRHPASRQYATETSLSEASKMLASMEKQANDLENDRKTLHDQIYEKISRRLSSAVEVSDQATPSSNTMAIAQNPPQDQITNKREFDEKQNRMKRSGKVGSSLRVTYDPNQAFKDPPTASELTLPMLMAAQTHLGHATSLWNPRNSSYIFGIRDGIHIISLDSTYAYLRRAAKVVQAVARRGGLTLFIGTRDKQEQNVVKAAKMAGGYHIFDRWVPGCLTNGQQILGHCRLTVVDVHDKELPKYTALLGGPSGYPVLKPDLVVCFNPLENEVCLHECGLHDVPTIGIIDTDADASKVTYPIPANDDSIRSVTLIAGVLGHAGQEGQRQRREEACSGKATYQTRNIEKNLKALKEMNDLRIEERAGGSRGG